MPTPLTELLGTLETLTSDAERDYLSDMCDALVSIDLRRVAIAQLVEWLSAANLVTAPEFERIKNIERSGADLLTRVQRRREQLQEELRSSARQRSFADCVTGILNAPPSCKSFDL